MRMITVLTMAFAISCTKTVPVLKGHDIPDTSDTGVVVTMPVDTGTEPVTTDTGTTNTGTTTTPCQDLTPNLQVFDTEDGGYHFGDYAQLKICVEYASNQVEVFLLSQKRSSV